MITNRLTILIKLLITNDKMLVFLPSHTVMFICTKHFSTLVTPLAILLFEQGVIRFDIAFVGVLI